MLAEAATSVSPAANRDINPVIVHKVVVEGTAFHVVNLATGHGNVLRQVVEAAENVVEKSNRTV
jgi:hypothetical protein